MGVKTLPRLFVTNDSLQKISPMVVIAARADMMAGKRLRELIADIFSVNLNIKHKKCH